MPQKSMDRSLIHKSAGNKRITKEVVINLKEKSRPRGVMSLFQGIGTVLMQVGMVLAPKSPIKKSNKCKSLGHVMPASGWQVGSTPKCVDCGKMISDPTEIRDSVWKV